MTVKKPGPEPVPAESATRLNLENVAEGAMPPYTSLFYDVLTGNRSLFTSSAGWPRRSAPSSRCSTTRRRSRPPTTTHGARRPPTG